jgi:CopG family nickel-responsive transcriptional regulator
MAESPTGNIPNALPDAGLCDRFHGGNTDLASRFSEPPMSIIRFSVSLEPDLLAEFDAYCERGRLATRSEAVRQLIREKLTAAAWADDAADVAASLTLVYDHHRARLTDKMIEIQHARADCVVAATHVHLTHDLCMEMIALRGRTADVQAMAADLSGLKGVHQAQLVVAKAGPDVVGDKERK